jgi:hypothetical protein
LGAYTASRPETGLLISSDFVNSLSSHTLNNKELAFLFGGIQMSCKRCSSDNQKEFGVEMNIHFPGREGIDKGAVVVFPQATVICLNCGFAEFSVPETELRRLATEDPNIE